MTNDSPTEGTLVSAEQFRRQLRFLKSRYELITPEMFHGRWSEGASLPDRAVLLTCDDGLLNVLTDMIPILLEESVRGLFFVTGASLEDAPASLWYEELFCMLKDAPGEAMLTVDAKRSRKDSLGRKDLFRYWWDLVHELSRLGSDERTVAIDSLRDQWLLAKNWHLYAAGDERAERRYRLLNRTELQQLVANGMTVGAHTVSHPILAQMPPELAEREIRECRSGLESFLQQEVWALAYPFGHEGSAGAREMRMASEAGYSCAFLNHGGGVSQRTSPRFGLPRAHVTAAMSLSELEANLTGFHQKLQRSNNAVNMPNEHSARSNV